MNTIGQFIDINNVMPWLDVCFLHQKGVDYSREDDYSREATISNISHRRLCLTYFVFLLYQAIKEKV